MYDRLAAWGSTMYCFGWQLLYLLCFHPLGRKDTWNLKSYLRRHAVAHATNIHTHTLGCVCACGCVFSCQIKVSVLEPSHSCKSDSARQNAFFFSVHSTIRKINLTALLLSKTPKKWVGKMDLEASWWKVQISSALVLRKWFVTLLFDQWTAFWVFRSETILLVPSRQFQLRQVCALHLCQIHLINSSYRMMLTSFSSTHNKLGN